MIAWAPLARLWLRRCERVGAAPALDGRPGALVDGGRILVGDRFRLASRPARSHLVAGPGATLAIGDDVRIAHGAGIAAYQRVEIGDGTVIGPFALIMDTNFHGGAGDQSVQHDTRPVVIGRGCRIGSRVTIMRGAEIGDGAEILAGSVVSSAIPSGACAGGARARVLGRAGSPASRWDGAAVELAAAVAAALGLPAAPDLSAAPAALAGGAAGEGAARLAAALARHFGVVLTPADCAVGSLAELAEVIEAARATAPAADRAP